MTFLYYAYIQAISLPALFIHVMQCYKKYYVTIKCEQMGLEVCSLIMVSDGWCITVFSIKLPLKNEYLGSGHYARIVPAPNCLTYIQVHLNKLECCGKVHLFQ